MRGETLDSATLQADEAQMRRFLQSVFKRCEGVNGWVALRAFEHEREGRAVANQWAPFGAGLLPSAAKAATQVAQRTGDRRAVFSPPVAIFGDQKNDKGDRFAGEANVICAPAIAVELDREPQESLAKLVQVLGEPTVTIASGGVWEGQPKLHAYWRLAEPATTDETKALLRTARKIATKLVDGDGTAVALSHPMRWPGSWHTKAEPKLCQIIGGDPTREINLSWAVEALDVALLAADLEIDGRGSLVRAERKGFKTEHEWPADDLNAAAEIIPNDARTTWDDWNTTGMAFYDASHGSPDGLEAFIYWSEKNDKGDADDAERRWKHFADSPPGNISAGKLIHLARATDPEFRGPHVSAEAVASKWYDDTPPPPEYVSIFKDPEPTTGPETAAKAIRATPYTFVEPAAIARREWLYGQHYIRNFISTTVAPSGVGKTALTIIEFLAMASGKPLLGVQPQGCFRVWLWNGEDPRDELSARIAAAMQHYGLTREDIGDRLFIDTGRETEIVLGIAGRDGAKIVAPVASAIIEQMLANRIDAFGVDPFVSSHRVPENDNGAIDLVAKQWAKIADATHSAIELVHHVRKLNGSEISVEDGRGAVALMAAARPKRALAGMTRAEAVRFGVEGSHYRFFRIGDERNNLALPAGDTASWFELKSVPLGNGSGGTPVEKMMSGDSVGVVTVYSGGDVVAALVAGADEKAAVLSRVREGDWRRDARAGDAWIGVAIAQAFNLDIEDAADKARVRAILSEWLKAGVLKEVSRKDQHRHLKTYIVCGETDNMSENTSNGAFE